MYALSAMEPQILTYGVTEAVDREPWVKNAIVQMAIEFDRTRPPGAGIDPSLALTLAVMYPVVRYVLVAIGLPWLHEATRYSELWRLRTDRWLDNQYRLMDLDPQDAARASKLLRQELEATTDLGARQAWERVREYLLKDLDSPVDPSDDPTIKRAGA